jgi:hypothetical protein
VRDQLSVLVNHHQQNQIYGHRAHRNHSGCSAPQLYIVAYWSCVEIYRLLTLLPSAAGYALRLLAFFLFKFQLLPLNPVAFNFHQLQAHPFLATWHCGTLNPQHKMPPSGFNIQDRA